MIAIHDLVKLGKVHYIGESSLQAVEFVQLQHIATVKGLTQF